MHRIIKKIKKQEDIEYDNILEEIKISKIENSDKTVYNFSMFVKSLSSWNYVVSMVNVIKRLEKNGHNVFYDEPNIITIKHPVINRIKYNEDIIRESKKFLKTKFAETLRHRKGKFKKI